MSDPHDVSTTALEGLAKGVALRINRSIKWIYKIAGERDHDPYARFIQIYLAVESECPGRGDLWFEDFKARREALQRSRKKGPTSIEKQAAKIGRDSAEVVADVLEGHSIGTIRSHVVRAIQDEEKLLAGLESNGETGSVNDSEAGVSRGYGAARFAKRGSA